MNVAFSTFLWVWSMWVWPMWVWSLTPPHIFTSLVTVRRALRLRKNYVKLSLYNHFAYTLIFAIIAAAVFAIWSFVEINFPKNGCLKVWGIEYWELDRV